MRFDIGGLCAAVAVSALTLGIADAAFAWSQPQWIRQIGTPDYDFATGVAVDGDGNAYISGGTSGSLGGPNQGSGDAWIMKYAPTGALLWKQQLGTPQIDYAAGVASDPYGDAHIAGSTTGALSGNTNRGSVDAFVAKYSAGGKLRWARQLGTSGDDTVTAVTSDRHGNVYIAGYTSGSLEASNRGYWDAFVAKYSTAGRLLWSRKVGSSNLDSASGVATDVDGNVYIAGSSWPVSDEPPPYPGGDAWVAKYSPIGSLIWERRQLFEWGQATGAATDRHGNIYICGYTIRNFDYIHPHPVIAKYSSAGAMLWRQVFGSSAGDVALGVATDMDGNAFVSGVTEGSFGGALQGSQDAWVSKFSARGASLWKRQLGTSGSDQASGVAADAHGNVYISGITQGSLGGSYRGGLYDSFIAKYSARQ
jgi:hypothetical protein